MARWVAGERGKMLTAATRLFVEQLLVRQRGVWMLQQMVRTGVACPKAFWLYQASLEMRVMN